MKISPVADGGGMPGQSIGAITSERISPERLASAKAVAMGQSPMRLVESDTPVDPQVARINHRRSIKMKVQQSTNRIQDPQLDAPVMPSAISSSNEEAVIEATKPLSPQFAALAKQRRALDVRERAVLDREQALQNRPTTDGSNDLAAQLKSQPLRVLQEQGVLNPEFYNSLTEFLVSGQSGINPEIQALKEEIKALKEGVDKNFVDRDTAAEQQVLSEMRREADSLAKEGDAFELVRETRSVPKVIDLIHRIYKKSGEVLDVSEAMQLVEEELLKENLKIANFKKIQSQFQAPQQQPQIQQRQQPVMRTLTNRDTAQPPLDRRQRAMMAALGTLKR